MVNETFPTGAPTPGGSAPAGLLLREAREQAGLSIDAVAQQLKLAPRQVKALEDSEFGLLPGRTFVRGFVRNYARLLHLDIDVVLAALPGAARDSGLESPTLHPTAPSIGELPVTQNTRPSWAKWAIPLGLIAIIAAGATYEMLRPATTQRATVPAAAAPPGEPARVPAAETKPAAPAPTAPAAAIAASPTTAAGTPLPNPVANIDATGGPALPPDGGAARPAATSGPLPAGAPPAAGAPAGPQPGDRELVLSYRDHSWSEVRDRNGRVLLSAMMAPGARQTLSGTGPFELVIGNATDVTLTLDGRTIDLAPYTRQSVARFTLP
jgi:cytoskeleton protein RodZ